jgi:hypothetical protein
MRYFEIMGGLQLPIDQEQSALITMIEEHDNYISEEILDERQLTLADNMVSRGILNRLQVSGKLYYETNKLEPTWRI